MSWQAQTWAIEMGKRYELDPHHRWMLMILANYADPEGHDIFPSIATLMADTGFSESTIRRHIKHLIACGLMDYGNQDAVLKFRAGHRPKVYQLLMTPQNETRHDDGSQNEGSQKGHLRGVNRGVTVTPKPVNPKEKPSDSAADAAAAAAGAAFREQLRLQRLNRMKSTA